MTLFKLTKDKVVLRLRWVMALVMFLDGVCTLIGQPPSYWHDFGRAQELDYFPRLFLVHGYMAFIIASLLYATGAILIVSFVPRKISLVILFTLLLGHFRGASAWMLYYLGFKLFQVNLVCLCLAILVVMAIGKAKDEI